MVSSLPVRSQGTVASDSSNVIGWGLGYTVAILWLSATWETTLGLISSIVILGIIPGLITGITLSLLPSRAT